MQHRHHPALHRFALITAVATFFLIIAGALVTSNDAGLAVPDWPLSFGQFMPEMVGGVFYEHGHRMIAASVGLLTLVLALWVGFREPRRWVRNLAFSAFLAVVIQGLLGGLTVVFLLPPAVSVLHACVAQAFFCMVVALAVVTARSWQLRAAEAPGLWQRPELRAALWTTSVVYLQLILGAILRHSGTVRGVKGFDLDPLALGAHLIGAAAVTVAVFTLSMTFWRQRPGSSLSPVVYSMVVLLLLQWFLGVGALLVRMGVSSRIQPLPLHVFITTGHVAVGALLLAASLILTLKLTRVSDSPAESLLTPSLAEEHP